MGTVSLSSAKCVLAQSAQWIECVLAAARARARVRLARELGQFNTRLRSQKNVIPSSGLVNRSAKLFLVPT